MTIRIVSLKKLIQHQVQLTSPRPPPGGCLPRLAKEGVKSGPQFISRLGSNGLKGVLFACAEQTQHNLIKTVKI